MKATETLLLNFFKNSTQFVIPIYQRHYSWTEIQCQQLWDDIMHVGTDKKIGGHFVGSVVYVHQGIYQVSNKNQCLVIDGQQRLTTCTLLLTALANHLKENNLGEISNGCSYKKIRSYYLLNDLEEGECYYKLLLSQADKDTLMAILDDAPLSNNASHRIQENYEFFKKQINQFKDLSVIWQGLNKLLIVDVSLDRTQDNPQLIFESMNSTGLALSQADLIRNYILMGLSQDEQERLYKNYWRKMELLFGQKAYSQHFDGFMRHYLTAKKSLIPNINKVYEEFKKFAKQDFASDMHELIKDVYEYATYYANIALNKESDDVLKRSFLDLKELKVDVALPFLLNVYHDYHKNIITKDDVHQIIQLIESYVFRRAVCDVRTNSLNKTFATLYKSFKKDNYLKNLQIYLMSLKSYRRFPDDKEFKSCLMERDMYNLSRCNYLLRKLENYGKKEKSDTANYSIEHVLPQNENLSIYWQMVLGDNWQEIQKIHLHRLGNLTLTGYNSEYSDCDYEYKRNGVLNAQGEKIGLAYSPLSLNQYFKECESWNEIAINKRSEILASKATKVWQLPEIDLSKLQSVIQSDKSSLDSQEYAHIINGSMNALFLVLQKEILNIDECVYEEYLKKYIAYKAERNFLAIIPQEKSLVLVLNMPFHKIIDPEQLCQDITNKGNWSNGDIRISISELQSVPYAVNLIRQSFDWQMTEK